ncbi:hypothetical protein IG631_02414 [Alternaria alternata]|nr:hypothetical protein IG631_02414 [Alternaria alternata]
MVYAPHLISRRVDSFVAAHVPRYQGRSRLQAYLSTFQCPPTTFIDHLTRERYSHLFATHAWFIDAHPEILTLPVSDAVMPGVVSNWFQVPTTHTINGLTVFLFSTDERLVPHANVSLDKRLIGAFTANGNTNRHFAYSKHFTSATARWHVLEATFYNTRFIIAMKSIVLASALAAASLLVSSASGRPLSKLQERLAARPFRNKL